MTPLEAAAALVRVDEKAIPETAVTVVSFITPTGEQAYKYSILGKTDLATLVGLLEIVKSSLFDQVVPE